MLIENYRMGSSPVIALFDVLFDDRSGMRLRNLKIVMSKKGTPFISFPSFQVEENGLKKWVPYLSFSKEREMEIRPGLESLLKPFAGDIFNSGDSHESNF